ncbi:hypothetical protein EVG20_g7778 [Dentipellis fragilis]|uniref:Uncharacterized protein n=1 Tax=Dentipellis fragilis TaxID=205917 RepID=A0A4Y9YD38_9AGAM|nr:hypothetical protein EVG20_g7778 [Dentipellis fragilis]
MTIDIEKRLPSAPVRSEAYTIDRSYCTQSEAKARKSRNALAPGTRYFDHVTACSPTRANQFRRTYASSRTTNFRQVKISSTPTAMANSSRPSSAAPFAILKTDSKIANAEALHSLNGGPLHSPASNRPHGIKLRTCALDYSSSSALMRHFEPNSSWAWVHIKAPNYNPKRDIPDLTGKVVIVTGANSGIGLRTSEQLALHGAKVYLACRTGSKAQAAIASIENATPSLKGQGRVVWLPLDLSSVVGSKKAADEFLAKEKRLDILINNAGRLAENYELSKEGLELSVAVNHFGHFIFTKTLLPLMKETAKRGDSDVRIVNLSSSAHTNPGNTKFGSLEKLNDPQGEPGKENVWGSKFKRYGKSKLMNVLFTTELQKHLDAENVPITVLAVHPGGVATEGASELELPWYFKIFLEFFAMDPLEGAFTSLFAATSAQIAAEREKYKGKISSSVWKTIGFSLPNANANITPRACREPIRFASLTPVSHRALNTASIWRIKGYIFARCDYDPARDIPDLTGKIAIVTGANSGIGLCTSEQLALHGAKVYIACRSEKRAREAIVGIEDRTPSLKTQSKLEWLPLDLSSIVSSKAAAEEFMEREKRLDILVNNAGRMAADYVLSDEGLELSVAVNHLGHFVFTNTLLSLMKETSKLRDSDIRIINVSSSAYIRPGNTNFSSVKEFNDPQSGLGKENVWGPSFKRYGKSKLMNHLFTAELQRRIDADSENTPITVITVHPGGVDSEGARQLRFPWYIKLFMKIFATSPLQGAFTSLFAATSPQVAVEREKYKGRYLVPYGKIATGTRAARDPSLARTLWETSVRVSGDILAQERQ